MKKNEKKDESVKIIHIMKDGTSRDYIDGYIIPGNDSTKIIYQMLAGLKAV
jgi:hypothetical protein